MTFQVWKVTKGLHKVVHSKDVLHVTRTMINIANEELITLEQAAAFCPRRRNNQRPHSQTLMRWARDGLQGVRLEVLRVGDTTCTTVAAMQRFFEALTEAADLKPVRSPRKAEINQEIERELDAIGV